jgi:hypothetical protein
MKVTFDIPEEFYVMAMTLVAPRLTDGSTHTFTHCFALQDGKTVQVKKEKQDRKPLYWVYEGENEE